jgi:hypothetical protein
MHAHDTEPSPAQSCSETYVTVTRSRSTGLLGRPALTQFAFSNRQLPGGWRGLVLPRLPGTPRNLGKTASDDQIDLTPRISHL